LNGISEPDEFVVNDHNEKDHQYDEPHQYSEQAGNEFCHGYLLSV
jgi:hypothetical protein